MEKILEVTNKMLVVYVAVVAFTALIALRIIHKGQSQNANLSQNPTTKVNFLFVWETFYKDRKNSNEDKLLAPAPVARDAGDTKYIK